MLHCLYHILCLHCYGIGIELCSDFLPRAVSGWADRRSGEEGHEARLQVSWNTRNKKGLTQRGNDGLGAEASIMYAFHVFTIDLLNVFFLAGISRSFAQRWAVL